MTWVATGTAVYADRTRSQIVADTDVGNGSIADKAKRATLIAAAPDLLAALQSIVRIGRFGLDDFDMQRAELAIAKATQP